jgi:hypothetical protein
MSSVQRWLIWLLCAVLAAGSAPPAQTAQRCGGGGDGDAPAERSCCTPGSCGCGPVVVVRSCCDTKAPPPQALTHSAPRLAELAPAESEPMPLFEAVADEEEIAWHAASPARPVHGGCALHLWLSVFRI